MVPVGAQQCLVGVCGSICVQARRESQHPIPGNRSQERLSPSSAQVGGAHVWSAPHWVPRQQSVSVAHWLPLARQRHCDCVNGRARFLIKSVTPYCDSGLYIIWPLSCLLLGMTHAEVNEAYERYGPLVHRRCLRILREKTAAEDTLQEVYIRLWRYGDSFREATSKIAWLYRVADNCCFDRLGRRGFVSTTETAPENYSDTDQSGAEGKLDDRELVLRILRLFEARVRQVVVLRYLDEMTHEEIAQETGWSRQTVIKKLAMVESQVSALRQQFSGGIDHG